MLISMNLSSVNWTQQGELAVKPSFVASSAFDDIRSVNRSPKLMRIVKSFRLSVFFFLGGN